MRIWTGPTCLAVQRAAVVSIYIPGNLKAQKNPSLITKPIGEKLEALTSLYFDHFNLFPHASFSFVFPPLTHCSHTNAITFQEDIYNLRHPSDQHFPVTFSPYHLAVKFFYVMFLQKFFLGWCSLNTATPLLTVGKFTFGWSETALWKQHTRYLAQVPNPVNHSLTWQHRALGKLNTLLICKDDLKFSLTPAFNQVNYVDGYYHS